MTPEDVAFVHNRGGYAADMIGRAFRDLVGPGREYQHAFAEFANAMSRARIALGVKS